MASSPSNSWSLHKPHTASRQYTYALSPAVLPEELEPESESICYKKCVSAVWLWLIVDWEVGLTEMGYLCTSI